MAIELTLISKVQKRVIDMKTNKDANKLNLSTQNGHRVRDSFEKLKFDEPLTHRDFERLKRQLRRDKEEIK